MYIQVRDLVIDNEKTVGENLLLTDVFPTYKYDQGIKTEEIVGYTYVVLLASRQYQQLRIKIPGNCQIDQGLLHNSTPRVQVQGLELTPYAMNGRTGVAAKAESIEVID